MTSHVYSRLLKVFNYIQKIIMASTDEKHQLEFQDDDETWINAFKVMRENKEMTDVILHCDGGEVEAHQLILSVHSPYFKMMFLNDLKESSTKQIDFSYVKKDVMILILDYIYLHHVTIKSNESVNRLIEIFQLAHLFQLDRLNDYFWKLIMKNMNTDDWLNIWELVLLHGSDQEISKVLYFILENISEIVENNFYTLTCSQVNQLLEKISQNKISIEDDFFEAIIEWSDMTQNSIRNLQSVLLQINFDLISTETMLDLCEEEDDLFDDTFFKEFFKLNILPRLKTKSEPHLDFPLKLFFFRFYRKDGEEVSKGRLEIFDCRKKYFCKFINKLPFHFTADIVPIQCGQDLYIIGGIPKGSPDTSESKSFFLYDWKKNRIHMKSSLLKEVRNPVTCVTENNIYVVGRRNTSSETVVQCFSIAENKWFARKCKDLEVRACVSVKDVIYLIYEKSSEFYLATLNNLDYTFHSLLPLPKDSVVSGNNVIVYRDKIFVLLRNSEWHTFDPDTNVWTIKKTTISPDYPASVRPCSAEKFIMFYNKEDHTLYRFHTNNVDVRKIMTVSKSLEHYVNVGACEFEEVLIFH